MGYGNGTDGGRGVAGSPGGNWTSQRSISPLVFRATYSGHSDTPGMESGLGCGMGTETWEPDLAVVV